VTLRARIVRIEEIEGESRRYEVGAGSLLEWDHQEAQVTEFPAARRCGRRLSPLS